MESLITSKIVVAYTQCPRKAYLLLFTPTMGEPHEYIRILEEQRRANQERSLDWLKQKHAGVQPYTMENLRNGSEVLTNAYFKADGVEAACGVLTKVNGHSTFGQYNYEPTIFVGTHSISKEQKLELFFVGYVLERLQHEPPVTGEIIGMDGKSQTVKLKNIAKVIRPLLEPLQEWMAATSPEPPPVILNKNCPICPFQRLCQTQAKQEDNLSLLDAVTTRAMRQYERKGIFTVKQLSFLFKPRKRKRRIGKSPSATHKVELQALAIRENKIYLQEQPALSRNPVELFLDIEGVPDRQFYYLIGLLVYQPDAIRHYSFWADTARDECHIWQQLLEKVSHYPDALIYHYGSYEPRAIDRLAKRYGADGADIIKRLVNVNRYIYGKVYFPVCSNRLKDIGKFLGATWTSPDASGLQSLVWRYNWEKTYFDHYKELLVTYNKEDCQALKLLTDKLTKIGESANTLSEVDFVDQPKRYMTKSGEQVHGQFETLLKFAHVNYDKKKISFRQNDKQAEDSQKRKYPSKKGYQGQRKVRPKSTKTVQVQPATVCPHHNELLQPTGRMSKRLIIDLVPGKNGIKKTITQYVGAQRYCRKCYRYHIAPDIRKYGANRLYGHGFQAWIVYQRVALRMTYGSIAEALAEQFNEKEPGETISPFIRNLSQYYVEMEAKLVHSLLNSPFIHADETSINIRGTTQYVWTFTNDKYVVFKLTKTRESTMLYEFLKNYNGILISDFYSGYDAIACGQQKCWVHLIRDLNSDLWEAAFDAEYEAFVCEVRRLIIPIMEAAQRYGLKKRHFNKFIKQVNVFYSKVITDRSYKSKLVLKYQKRFIRYRESLFTFLEHDGIPWHNNAAERALRHIAKQREISGDFHESVTHDYLRLLGIRQTCRFQGKSFFKFLFSEETDLDKFAVRNRKRESS